MAISTLGRCAVISLIKQQQNHRIVFKRMGNYTTDVHFHRNRLPVNLTKIIKTPVKALETITKFVNNIYQQSFNSLRNKQQGEGSGSPSSNFDQGI